MSALEQARKFMWGPKAPPPNKLFGDTTQEARAVPTPQSFLLKFRSAVGFFLVLNVCIGATIIIKTTKDKKRNKKEAEAAGKIPIEAPRRVVAKPQRRISVNEQRQLFQWMLDEKRKIKVANTAEKAHIDEEKKLLKQFLRAPSIPSL